MRSFLHYKPQEMVLKLFVKQMESSVAGAEVVKMGPMDFC